MNRFSFFLFLILGLLSLFLGYLWTKSRISPPQTLPSPTPLIPSTISSPQPTQLPNNYKQEVILQLPYIGYGFTIEYFPDRDWFFIQINKPPYEKYELEAKNWFRSKNLDPTSLNIEWGSTRGIAPRTP